MYTTNGFYENTRFLRRNTVGCSWAKGSDIFTTGNEKLDSTRILCVVKGEYSPWRKDFRLLISDNYFTSNGDAVEEYEPAMQDGRTVSGIVNIATVKKYIVAAASAEGTDEMALYVSDDSITWHRAVFPHDHRLEEDAYTLLESTNYSIQVDVMTTRPSNPMGVLFSSNSNGTYFTRNLEHTNRNMMGFVDFEKVSGIQGIVLVNAVDNWEEVETKIFAEKKVISRISFDDGRTFQDLKADKQKLNLHSVSDARNSGRIFSSPAPGLVMGIGNTGDYLKKYSDGDLYVSDDAGVTWWRALDGPHKYEFGDQGSILVAVKDGETDEISYSLDHGKKWKSLELPEKVVPGQLTTTQDSTSLKFLLLGIKEKDKSDRPEYHVMSIDFDDMHERQCKESDLEKWYARVDEKGEPTCLMGHKQYYMRRKADADCFLMQEFKDPVAQSEPCECTDADFECDYNFVRSEDRKDCILKGSLVVPEGECKAFDKDTTFRGSSGWRLIPGDDCKRASGPQKDDPVDRKCSESASAPASGKISHATQTFSGDGFKQKIYLERTETSTGKDETVIMWTDKGYVFLSHDHGKKWEEILKDVKVTSIYTNPYFKDVVYFLTSSKTVWYSTDRGDNIRKFEAPLEPTEDLALSVMHFHPKHKDWFIWTGAKDCGTWWSEGKDCHSVAELTTDRGDNWKTIARYVKKCEFIHEAEKQNRSDKLIYCEARARENSNADNPYQLISSEDFFDESKVHFENVVDYATMAEFIVVATRDEKDNQFLKASASVDGVTFADARFPPDFNVPHQKGYTVLDSSTHSVFLHVTVEDADGFEYGSIIKSNSNGTSYVLSINNINRDHPGYVDFEKMHGLEGVALVNIVSNADSKDKKGGKKLKTMITHNDGAEWDYLPPPAKDFEGKSYCSGPREQCALHIHSYTERSDKSKTFSSASAIGLMLGVGNVGEYLGPYAEADTFVTSNGGINWLPAKKGSYMWEFGDQGSVIVLVKEKTPVGILYYSRDEGQTWQEYKFAESSLQIDDITTLPSDNSRNFLLWGRTDEGLVTINIDFTGLTDRQCDLNEKGENEDYYLWTPKHPKQEDDCLFGHVAQYHRKKPEAECYNGRTIQSLHNIARNCTCTRQDFEWFVSPLSKNLYMIAMA
jgi:hypothetical protein